MEWHKVPVGGLQTNCYILHKNGECIVFDPGEEGEKLITFLEEKKLQPLAIMLTHAHFDHIGAVDKVRDRYNVQVYIHEREAEWLLDPDLNGSGRFMGLNDVKAKPADHLISKEQLITVGPFELQTLHTPGHSPGSVSYYLKSINTIISGDTLFSGGIGRTDLRDGDHSQLLESIHSKLLTLPEETVVLPGHGSTTTIGNEMDSNPYLHGF